MDDLMKSLAREYLSISMQNASGINFIYLDDGTYIEGNYAILKLLKTMFDYKFTLEILYT